VSNYPNFEKIYNNPTIAEERVVEAINTFKKALKDPSSLKIYELAVQDGYEKYKLVFIDITYGANNSWGASIQDETVLCIMDNTIFDLDGNDYLAREAVLRSIDMDHEIKYMDLDINRIIRFIE